MQAISNGLLYTLCLGVAAYVVFAYGFLPLGSAVHPDMKARKSGSDHRFLFSRW